MARNSHLDKQHGPVYNVQSAPLAKFRFMAREGLAAMSREDRRAYGEAVEIAVLAKQRSECAAAIGPAPRINCASGTTETTGEGIDRAIRAKHRAALAACPGQVRRARKPEKWQSMYEEAMAEKAATNTPEN